MQKQFFIRQRQRAEKKGLFKKFFSRKVHFQFTYARHFMFYDKMFWLKILLVRRKTISPVVGATLLFGH